MKTLKGLVAPPRRFNFRLVFSPCPSRLRGLFSCGFAPLGLCASVVQPKKEMIRLTSDATIIGEPWNLGR